jgi:hypothetical protein
MRLIGLKKIKYWLGKIKYLGGVASLAAVLVGCSSHTSPGEAIPYKAGDVVAHPVFVQVVKPDPSLPQPQFSSSPTQEVIGVDGGTIQNGNVSLDFPPGALAQDVTITILMDENGLVIADLTPEGLQFGVPVTLTMDLEDTSAEGDAANTYIAWHDPGSDGWVIVENLAPLDSNTIRARLDHFSKYGGVLGYR